MMAAFRHVWQETPCLVDGDDLLVHRQDDADIECGDVTT